LTSSGEKREGLLPNYGGEGVTSAPSVKRRNTQTRRLDGRTLCGSARCKGSLQSQGKNKERGEQNVDQGGAGSSRGRKLYRLSTGKIRQCSEKVGKSFRKPESSPTNRTVTDLPLRKATARRETSKAPWFSTKRGGGEGNRLNKKKREEKERYLLQRIGNIKKT